MKRLYWKPLLVSLSLTLALLLGAGCDLSTTTDSQPPPDNDTTTPADQISQPQSFVAVVEKVKPSVVTIDVEFNGQVGAGSGWIIDSDGIIVTNSHVVHGANKVTVTLDDGRTFTAIAVYSDPRSDLAVVKIDVQNLPAAETGDSSQLKVGQPVAAIGNALGLGITMKGGWVSRLDTSITFDNGQTLYGLIETDAAINEGNSGGPLVDMAGEVIGITSAKLIDINIEGIGYAISINSALPLIEDLINVGYIVRPFLGVGGLLTVTASVAESFGLGTNEGVLVRSIVPDGPALQAGLEVNDVIVGVDDEETLTVEELILAIHSKYIGQQVEISYFRGSSQHTVYVILGETPPPA